LVAGARGNDIIGLGRRRAAVERAARGSGPLAIGSAGNRRGRTGVTRCAGCSARRGVISRARIKGVTGLDRGSPAVTVRARGGTRGCRVNDKSCRARARKACARGRNVGASTGGVGSGAADGVVRAAGLVHTHQIGGDITGVAGASKPSTGRSHIDARAVAAAGIVETTVDVDARADRVKITRVTLARIAIEGSYSIDAQTISAGVINAAISVYADTDRVCGEASLTTNARSAGRGQHACKPRAG